MTQEQRIKDLENAVSGINANIDDVWIDVLQLKNKAPERPVRYFNKINVIMAEIDCADTGLEREYVTIAKADLIKILNEHFD